MKVERRRSRKGEQRVTFFFRNFPERYTGEDLKRCFRRVGSMVDVYIPRKRDKMGSKIRVCEVLVQRRQGKPP